MRHVPGTVEAPIGARRPPDCPGWSGPDSGLQDPWHGVSSGRGTGVMHWWVGVLVLLGFWGLHIWTKPFVTCRHCEGKKRKYASDDVHYSRVECFWCYESGERYRWELRWLTLF